MLRYGNLKEPKAKRFFVLLAGFLGLAAFLGLIVLGIFKLQGPRVGKPTGPSGEPIPPKEGDTMATNVRIEKREILIDAKLAKETFSIGSISVSFGIASNGELVSYEADLETAKQLVAKIPELPSTGFSYPAEFKKDAQNGNTRIYRERPIEKIDREKTFNCLLQGLKETSTDSRLIIEVQSFFDKGEKNFDSIRAQLGFNSILASFSTIHNDHIDDIGRNENLRIASERIDGLIVLPGQEFNFDKVVGQRSKKNGFQLAGVISNGRVIPGLGGGVCQVSTTLYRVALLSNFKILERHNHSIYEGIPYADRGLDAAVSWGSKNFCFKNSLDIPILVSCIPGKGRVDCQIFAERRPFDMVHVITRNETEHPYDVKIIHKNKAQSPEKKIVRPGVKGYSIETYRMVTVHGVSQPEERLSKDRYLTFQQVEEVSN